MLNKSITYFKAKKISDKNEKGGECDGIFYTYIQIDIYVYLSNLMYLVQVIY